MIQMELHQTMDQTTDHHLELQSLTLHSGVLNRHDDRPMEKGKLQNMLPLPDHHRHEGSRQEGMGPGATIRHLLHEISRVLLLDQSFTAGLRRFASGFGWTGLIST
jgi:hypothetical protein